LLQKNFYLHQSAKDGFRAYIQAYASYGLKKIFDVNALDLAGVGKAFGFSVPPRVNVNVGTGTSKPTPSQKKRRRNEDEEPDVLMTPLEPEPEDNEHEEEPAVRVKQRRVEKVGRKKAV
jgi:ATP-dependent RNA helicase DDX18/HAS1